MSSLEASEQWSGFWYYKLTPEVCHVCESSRHEVVSNGSGRFWGHLVRYRCGAKASAMETPRGAWVLWLVSCEDFVDDAGG